LQEDVEFASREDAIRETLAPEQEVEKARRVRDAVEKLVAEKVKRNGKYIPLNERVAFLEKKR
jgi:hypothetical protein